MGSIVLHVNGSTVGNVADGAGLVITKSVSEEDSARLITALHDYYRSHFSASPGQGGGEALPPTIENIIKVWWDDVIRQALRHVERYEARNLTPPPVTVSE